MQKVIFILFTIFLASAASSCRPGEDRLDDIEREQELPIDDLHDVYPF